MGSGPGLRMAVRDVAPDPATQRSPAILSPLPPVLSYELTLLGRPDIRPGDLVRFEVEEPAPGQEAEVALNPVLTVGAHFKETVLTHRAEEIEINPAAVIEGEITALEPRASDAAERAAVRIVASIIFFGLAFLIGVIVLMTLLAALLPALMNRSTQRMNESPLAVLGAGFLIAFAAPVVMLLLTVTIIGIPIAGAVAIVYAVAGMLAIAATAYYLGRKASGLMARGETPPEPKFAARLGWTALAMLALLIVGMIPILGSLVWLAAFVFGLGAAAIEGARLLAFGGAPAQGA